MLFPQDVESEEVLVQKPPLPGLEEQILASWVVNAAAWTRAIRRGEVLSRERVTNGAILEAISAAAPRNLLDLGCGEGWLSHQCARQGIEVLGTDAVAELTAIAADSAPPGARFQTLTYQQIAAGGLDGQFDAVVANFSLLGDRSLDDLFQALPKLLNPGGCVLVQTLHPLLVCAEQSYEDGWREGSWAGFSPAFRAPAPWYFRTMESWMRLFRRHDLVVKDVREPVDPLSGQPASMIFQANHASTQNDA